MEQSFYFQILFIELKCWWTTWLDPHQTSMEIHAGITWSCQKWYKDKPSYLISFAVQNKSIYFRNKKQAVCIQNQLKSESGRITGNVQINAQHTITNWLHQRQRQWKDHNMNHLAGDLQISRAELKKAVTCLCLLSLTQGLIGHLCLHNDSEGEMWLADSELD